MNAQDIASIERACARLISLYAYLNDERRYEELGQLFTEDAVLYRPSAPGKSIAGRAAIIEAFKQRSPDVLTFHVCTDILINASSATEASGQSRILLLSSKGAGEERLSLPIANIPVPGIFRDQFLLTQDGWKFTERKGSFWMLGT